MSSAGEQLKAVAVMTGRVFVGGLAVLLIWFVSPPWLSVPVRIILTTLVLLAWPVWILIRHFRQQRATRRAPAPAPEERADDARQHGRRAQPPPQGTYEELTRGSEEVVRWLRKSKLGDAGDPAYALPWYLVAGPADSGKTSLLLSSGMSFHALPSQRASEQNLVRPTRDCDWRVTDTSIWLDTSGRYQTEGDDRDEWAALIETLKRYRKSRPLDGFVLAVNAAQVMRGSEVQAEQQAKVLRARLDEAAARAGSRFPVYLVFTHMDEVEGFPDFFASFNSDERRQVWGVTIPLAREDNLQARFDAEFDHLYARLLRRRVVQLGATPTVGSQLRIFKFPGYFRRARTRLGHFAGELFRPNRFSDSPLLRGFYFTSSGGTGAAGARQLSGAPYFTQGLFRDVLLPDRNIAAAAQSVQGHPHLRRNVLLGVAAALLLLFLGGMTVSYFNNQALLAEATELDGKLIRAMEQTGRGAGATQLEHEIEVLSDVRKFLEKLDEHERNSPPLWLRFGLYAGGRINTSSPTNKDSLLRHHYFDTVDKRFFHSAYEEVLKDLRKFAADSGAAAGNEEYLGSHFDLLKVYLMLSRPNKVEADTYERVLSAYSRRTAPPGKEAEALAHLKYIASQAHKEDAPHPQPDSDLVARVRGRLGSAYPVINHVYRGILSDIAVAGRNNQPVNLQAIPHASDKRILSSAYTVPASFTLNGYKAMTEKLESSVAEQFRRQEWVVRDDGASPDSDDKKKNDLAAMYYNDYTTHWRKFLEDIKVKNYEDKKDATETLKALAVSGAASPLESLLREVAHQTNLSAGDGGWAWIKSFFSSEVVIGSTPVEKEFRPLILYVAGKRDSSPVAKYQAHLREVAVALDNDQRSVSEISKAFQPKDNTVKLYEKRKAVEDAIAENGLASYSGSAAAAKLLRQPLDNLYAMLVGVDFEQTEKRWQELSASAESLENGFPFGGGSDVTLEALVQYLNPQDGALTVFFNERLRPYFENDWSLKKEASDKFSPEFARYMADARRLSTTLFPGGGKQPLAGYHISVAPIAGGVVSVSIDGNQTLTPENSPLYFTWPNNRSGVRIVASSMGEPDATPKTYGGDWGVLHLFREACGANCKGPPFVLNPPQTRVSLTIQPKSADPKTGNFFRRELFALKAPKSIRPAPRAQ